MTGVTVRVFLVVQHDGPAASPFIVERDGRHLAEHKCWNVNMREPGCGSPLIQSVPEEKVYATRAAAEERLRAVADAVDPARG